MTFRFTCAQRQAIQNAASGNNIAASAAQNGQVDTGPIAIASFKPRSTPLAKASREKNSLALSLHRVLIASRCVLAIAIISASMTCAHNSASGFRSHPVWVSEDADESKSGSTMLSVGPPELHARTGKPQIMASTGPMPKCSFAGVYSNARVDEEVRRADRWGVVKLSKKRTSGSAAFPSANDEREIFEDVGVRTEQVSEAALDALTRDESVLMLSSRRGSYPPAITRRSVSRSLRRLLRTQNASIASCAFFFFSNLFSDSNVPRELQSNVSGMDIINEVVDTLRLNHLYIWLGRVHLRFI